MTSDVHHDGTDAGGRTRVATGKVLPPGVPFPDGIRAGGLLFVSGQLGNVPGQMRLREGGIAPETLQAVLNVRTVLQSQGLDLGDIVRCTVMLRDMGEWHAFNTAYEAAFTGFPLPARSAFGCAGLALDARVEIEVTAAS
jgi:reactive intermediate/imine deaminase